MTESVVVPTDDHTWMRCYTRAIERYEDVCMAVFRTLAEHGSMAELVDHIANSMDGCDCVDEESIALYERAKAAAIQHDREGGLRR